MSTRSKSKSIANETKQITKKHIENSWIILIKESILSNARFNVITLPHPSTGSPTKFCLDENTKKIYEIITFNEPYRSWFIEDTVKSDGNLLLATPINPVFLVLPRLRSQCSERAIPLEDLLSEKGFDKILRFISNIDTVADLKGPAEVMAYKYNEEKALTWLESKVHTLCKKLKEKHIHVTSGAVSATYVSSNAHRETVDEEFYLKYAHGIISEYLEDYLVELLETRFNFKKELIEHLGNKRKSEMEEIKETNKKIKYESDDNEEFKFNLLTPEIKKPKILSAKEKARQKAASGTKTISSFFSKK